MIWFDWVLVGWWLLSILSMIVLVGEPRKPITPGTAAWGFVVNTALIVGLVLTRT